MKFPAPSFYDKKFSTGQPFATTLLVGARNNRMCCVNDQGELFKFKAFLPLVKYGLCTDDNPAIKKVSNTFALTVSMFLTSNNNDYNYDYINDNN